MKYYRNVFLLRTVFVFLFFNGLSFQLKGQYKSKRKIDGIVKSIETAKCFDKITIIMDTSVATESGIDLKIEDDFDVYRICDSKKIGKIIWKRAEGEFYDSLQLYYDSGKPIKGIINGRYRADDIGPEFTANEIFYVINDRIVYDKKYRRKKYRVNVLWYFTTLSETIKIAGVKLE
jgi:hypothetical protein